MVGKIISRSSSTRSFSSRVLTSVPLPWTRIVPSVSSISLFSPPTTSPEMTVVFCHSGSVSVFETTYFGSALSLSANSPSRDGQAAAKPSYVTRPRSVTSELVSSSSLNLFPSSPRSYSKVQPPCSKSSEPPGSSNTPSTETNSVTTSLPIFALLWSKLLHPKTVGRSLTHRWRRTSQGPLHSGVGCDCASVQAGPSRG